MAGNSRRRLDLRGCHDLDEYPLYNPGRRKHYRCVRR